MDTKEAIKETTKDTNESLPQSKLTNIINKIKSFLPKSTASGENEIDIIKTFSSESIDVTPIIKQILKLHIDFPQNILNSKEGHKYNELEFFQSNQDSNSTNNTKTNSNALFEKFNRTYTQIGKTLLQSIILEPNVGSNTNRNAISELIILLTHRQRFANSFLINPNLDEIRKKIEMCSKIEKDILAMQMDDSPEMQDVYKVVFFQFLPLQKLNYNETFLKLFYYFIIIFSPAYGSVAPFLFMFAPYVFMRYILKVPLPFDVFWNITKNMILGGTGFFSNLNKILNSGLVKVAETMSGGGSNEDGSSKSLNIKSILFSLAKWFVAFMNSSAGTYIYIGFLVITYLYGIYNSVQVSITYNKIINMFHSRLNIISKWLKVAVEFYKLELGFEFPELQPVIIQIKELLTNSTIINLLNNITFNDEPSILSNKGIIIKTFKEFLDAKNIIEPFCKYMAYIDVWSSVGKWLKEGKGIKTDNNINNRSICNFIKESDIPIVNGSDIWNICCSVPVYNDVNLNGRNDNNNLNSNMLITGPNGSGKSTYIKSVIECILLGQTIGIVPAREFSFTPFTNIATYLNIPDCQGKESLFQAEMNRCYQQLQVLNEAESKGHFSFNIMDEIFVSTNYQEGMSGAYAIIKNMCKMKKCLNIITTHFDVLAGMDEVCVAKKYFDIEIDENDNIKGDYKIRNGVSKKHLALKLLKKKGFDASIIADAEFLYDKLQQQDLENPAHKSSGKNDDDDDKDLEVNEENKEKVNEENKEVKEELKEKVNEEVQEKVNEEVKEKVNEEVKEEDI
jgi:DNA mismatch repair ATPase MutS